MTSDDRTETITDRAAIRDSDEPSERGDFPCRSGARAAGDSVGALDIITILDRAEWAQQAIGTSSFAYPCVSVDVPALVAEVRRLTVESERRKRAGESLAEQGFDALTRAESAETARDEFEAAYVAADERARDAEAEVRTLRAKVAEGRRIIGSLAETVESECDDDPDICHEHDRYEGRCALLMDLDQIRAALATGEGK